MALNVKFLKGTQTAYDALAAIDEYTFYYITDSQDLYLGGIKLSSASDLAAAIVRLEAVEETADKVENAVVSISAEQSNDKTGTVLTFTDAQGNTNSITVADLFLSGAVYDVDTHILSLSVAGQSTPVEVDLEALVPKEVVADEVALANNIIATVDFGNISQGDVIDISDTESVQALFEAILSQDINPTTVLPVASSSGATSTGGGSSQREVGNTLYFVANPVYTLGSYSDNYYGEQETGVSVTSWTSSLAHRNSLTETVVDTVLETFSGEGDEGLSSIAFSPVVPTDGDYYQVRTTIYYSDGNIPTTYLGKDYPEGQITASSFNAYSNFLYTYRCGFYGSLTSKSDEINSALVRSLGTKTTAAVASGNTYTVSVPSGALRVMVAYPASIGTITSITSAEQFGSEIKDSFDLYVIDVNDASGSNPMSYNVYVKDLASAQETATTYTVTI